MADRENGLVGFVKDGRKGVVGDRSDQGFDVANGDDVGYQAAMAQGGGDGDDGSGARALSLYLALSPAPALALEIYQKTDLQQQQRQAR